MISLAILGLMQALFIPGFLISSVISKYTKLSIVDNLLIATPLSLVLNYFIVSILEGLHTYTQPVMLLIIGAELVALLVVLARQVSPNSAMTTATGDYIKESLPNKHYLTAFLNVLAFGLLITIYRESAGSVFEWWDAVASWNRWAKEWFDQSRGGTAGYPPGVPILYSLVYKLAGTTNVQTIAKLVASYFPFFGLFCFWRLGRLQGRLALASSIAGIIFVYLLAAGMKVSFVFSGYVDPIMAALGAFVLYALFISTECTASGVTGQERKYVIALMTIAVSSIAMVKQSGVPVALLFALMTAYSFRRELSRDKGYWAGLALIFGLLVTHYYVFSYLCLNGLPRAENLIKERQLFLRPYSAFKLLLTATGKWLWLLVAGSLFVDRWSRWIFFVLIVPLFLFWALLVSYSLRTAFVFFPWLALLAGIALAKVADIDRPKFIIFFLVCYLLFGEAYLLHPDIAQPEWVMRISAQLYLLYFAGDMIVKNYASRFQFCTARRVPLVIMGIIALCLAVLPFFKSADSLIAENTLKRIQSNDKGFNEKLSKLFEQDSKAKMISCWQMVLNIPALEGRFTAVGTDNNFTCGPYSVTIWLARPDIEYLLLWSVFDKNLLQETRELLAIKGISFTEENLAKHFTLFKKK